MEILHWTNITVLFNADVFTCLEKRHQSPRRECEGSTVLVAVTNFSVVQSTLQGRSGIICKSKWQLIYKEWNPNFCINDKL